MPGLFWSFGCRFWVLSCTRCRVQILRILLLGVLHLLQRWCFAWSLSRLAGAPHVAAPPKAGREQHAPSSDPPTSQDSQREGPVNELDQALEQRQEKRGAENCLPEFLRATSSFTHSWYLVLFTTASCLVSSRRSSSLPIRAKSLTPGISRSGCRSFCFPSLPRSSCDVLSDRQSPNDFHLRPDRYRSVWTGGPCKRQNLAKMWVNHATGETSDADPTSSSVDRSSNASAASSLSALGEGTFQYNRRRNALATRGKPYRSSPISLCSVNWTCLATKIRTSPFFSRLFS